MFKQILEDNGLGIKKTFSLLTPTNYNHALATADGKISSCFCHVSLAAATMPYLDFILSYRVTSSTCKFWMRKLYFLGNAMPSGE